MIILNGKALAKKSDERTSGVKLIKEITCTNTQKLVLDGSLIEPGHIYAIYTYTVYGTNSKKHSYYKPILGISKPNSDLLYDAEEIDVDDYIDDSKNKCINILFYLRPDFLTLDTQSYYGFDPQANPDFVIKFGFGSYSFDENSFIDADVGAKIALYQII